MDDSGTLCVCRTLCDVFNMMMKYIHPSDTQRSTTLKYSPLRSKFYYY